MTVKNLLVITPSRVFLHPDFLADLMTQWRLNYNLQKTIKILRELDEDLEVRWMEPEDLLVEAEFRMPLQAARSISNRIFAEYQNATAKTISSDSDESETQSQTSN
jgi:hypothetical protein